jgi:hypothetical protein
MPKCKEHPEEEATYKCQSCWKDYCERCMAWGLLGVNSALGNRLLR